MVFYHAEYNDKEKQKLKEFKDFCKKKGVKVPEVDAEVMKCLHGEKFDVEDAYKALNVRLNFLNERLPLKVSPVVFDLIQKGFIYVCGRDRQYRPIVVMNGWISRTLPELPAIDEILATFMLVSEYINKYMLVPGKVENIIQINNSNKMGFNPAMISRMKEVMGVMQNVYKGRLRSVMGVNAPATFALVWRTIRFFIDENTRQKINISSEPVNPLIHQLAAPNQFEEKFGGTQKNREEGEYWPPYLPDMDFGID